MQWFLVPHQNVKFSNIVISKLFFLYCFLFIYSSYRFVIAKVVALNIFAFFFVSTLLHWFKVSFLYCSSNYHKNDSCCSFMLLKAIAKKLIWFGGINIIYAYCKSNIIDNLPGPIVCSLPNCCMDLFKGRISSALP